MPVEQSVFVAVAGLSSDAVVTPHGNPLGYLQRVTTRAPDRCRYTPMSWNLPISPQQAGGLVTLLNCSTFLRGCKV